MNYFDAWTLVAGIVAFNIAYFSYKSGYNAGVERGVASALDQLEAQGLIELEDSPED